MDEQINDTAVLDEEDTNTEYAPAEQTEMIEPEPADEKNDLKKKKKQKSPDSSTKTLLIAILIVGICLLIVSVIGMLNAGKNMNGGDVAEETTTSVNNQINSGIPGNEATTSANNAVVDNNVNVNVQDPAEQTTNSADANANSNTPVSAPQSDAEWLSFFNTAVNKLKTDGASFSKSKRTQTADIKLSNSLAQAYVSTAKDKYLSDETVVTDVSKGDTATAKSVVSPDGESFVSNLAMNDIKSITHTVKSDGNYEITIAMPDATNPDLTSSYAKIFEFMLVDDVMDTYAPNMGATVEKSNVYLNYSGCYAQAVITPDGKVVSYYTKVNANMVLKDAKISVVKTDLDVTLYSDTNYTNIVW